MIIIRFRRGLMALLVTLTLLTSVALNVPARAAGKLKIVATLNVFADLVTQIARAN